MSGSGGGLVGLSIAPALFGYSAGNTWGALIGHLVVALVALALQDLLVRLFPRFGHRLRVDRATLSTLQAVAMATVTVQLFFVDAATPATRALTTFAVLAVVAALAAASTRHHVPRGWSFFAGLTAAAAVSALPFAVLPFATSPTDAYNGALALIPAVVAVIVVALAASRPIAPLRRTPLLVGAWTGLLTASLPALAGSGLDILSAGSWLFGSWTAAVGVAALTIGTLALSALAARNGAGRGLVEVTREVGILAGIVTLLGAITIEMLPKVAQVAAGLALAFALALVVVRFAPVVRSPLRVRVPLLLGAHVLLVLVSVIAATETSITVLTGGLVVVGLFLLSRAIPVRARPVYTALGFAWALITFATALNLLKVDAIPLLCLVTVVVAVTTTPTSLMLC